MEGTSLAMSQVLAAPQPPRSRLARPFPKRPSAHAALRSGKQAIPSRIVAAAAATETTETEAQVAAVLDGQQPEAVTGEAPAPPVEAPASEIPAADTPAADAGAPKSDRKTFRKTREGKIPVSELKLMQEYQGKVIALKAYGVFVDVGAQTDGLLHISKLSREYVKSVEDVVKVGDVITVRITEVDTKTGKFGLTALTEEQEAASASPAAARDSKPRGAPRGAPRAPRAEPGTEAAAGGDRRPSRGKVATRGKARREGPVINLTKGQEVTGTVARTAAFGVFIDLPEGISALLPTSEIVFPEGKERASARELFAEGDAFTGWVLKVEGGKVAVTQKSDADRELEKQQEKGVSSQKVVGATSPLQYALAAAGVAVLAKKEHAAASMPAADAAEQPQTEPVAAAVVEEIAVSEAVAAPVAEPEPTAEEVQQPEAVAAPIAEPEAVAAPVAEPEKVAESEPVPEPEAAAAPVAEPEKVAESEPVPEPEAAAAPVADPEPVAEPEPVPEAVAAPVAEPEQVAEPESVPEPEAVAAPAAEPEAVTEEPAVPEPEVATPEAVSTPVAEPESIADEKPAAAVVEEATPEAEVAPVAEAVPEPAVAVQEAAVVPAASNVKAAKDEGSVSAALVKQLRDLSGAGMMDCKKALKETNGDVVKAQEFLRLKGLASAEKKAGRVAAEGAVWSYIHAGARLGVLVEVNCETDFVARGDVFLDLVNDMAMQVAASPDVQYVSVDDIPEEFKEKERAIESQKEDIMSKPEAVRGKMVEGRIAKTLKTLSLLDAPYIKDPNTTVGEHVKSMVAKIGENIQIRRFHRYNLGEGIEKKESNLAEEVAAQTAAFEAAAAKKAAEASAAPAAEAAPEAAAPAVQVSAQLVKKLRESSGAGMMDCKKALAASEGDLEKATEWLRKKGLAGADKKAGRVAADGAIGSYIHSYKFGVLVEVNCETDFVARSDKFKQLVNDMAMQIAACTQVEFISVEDFPAEELERERQIELQKEDLQSKPEAIREKIVEGRVQKIAKERALLEQDFIKDTTKTVREYVKESIAALGENIQIRRFVRFNLGEGIAKKESNFAEEVAAQTGGLA